MRRMVSPFYPIQDFCYLWFICPVLFQVYDIIWDQCLSNSSFIGLSSGMSCPAFRCILPFVLLCIIKHLLRFQLYICKPSCHCKHSLGRQDKQAPICFLRQLLLLQWFRSSFRWKNIILSSLSVYTQLLPGSYNTKLCILNITKKFKSVSTLVFLRNS